MNDMKNVAVRLRALEPEDLDMLYAMENDHEVWNVGENNVPYSRYVLHDYIANATADIYADRQVRMMVENVDGECVGLVDLVNFSPAHCRAEVSIVSRRDMRRRGYPAAAVSHVTAYALRTLHLHQLYAVVAVDNAASLRLFDTLGFKPSSQLKDWIYDGKSYRDAVVMQRIL